MVLGVRKVITMLEECFPWYIFTAKQRNAANITANISPNITVILGHTNLKKVLRNPGGTDILSLNNHILA